MLLGQENRQMGNWYVVVRFDNGRRWSGHFIGDINDFTYHLDHKCKGSKLLGAVPFVHFPEK